MKLAIIYPSHRPHLVLRSYNSRANLKPLDYTFCVVGQYPVTETVLGSFPDHMRWCIEPQPIVPGLLDMVKWYNIGMSMGSDAEYFLIVDDDHHYKAANDTRPSSGTYYQECLDFMDTHPNVGFMMTKSYFGGAAWGDTPKINPDNGLVSLGWGMFLRNVPAFQLTDEELAFQGSMVESLLCYKIMAMGYDLAKRFNCPTLKDPGKTVGSGGISYSHETLNANIVGYIRRIYDDPTWEHESKKYPKGLWSQYLKAKTERTTQEQ